MQITARYSSSCPACGHTIAAGTKVEWSRGAKARHVQCPARIATPAPRPQAPQTPSVEAAPYVRREKWAPCKRAALPDTVGKVRVAGATKRDWAGLREGAVGEPVREGDALVVAAQTAYYESAEDNEDMGDMSGPGWHVTLYLRRATEAEGAPALARAAEANAQRAGAALRAAQIRELRALCERGWGACDDAAIRPAGREIVLDPGVSGSGRTIAILSPEGGAVAVWCGGYYDDYRPTLWVSAEPRAVEVFVALAGGAS